VSRKAILIESSKLKDHPDLPGARADVDNFSQFLQSEIGGSWYEWEIPVGRCGRHTCDSSPRMAEGFMVPQRISGRIAANPGFMPGYELFTRRILSGNSSLGNQWKPCAQ
jgi:hypothetical protein